VAGNVPLEFEDPNEALNEASAPEWAVPIFGAARTRLEAHLASNGSPAKEESADVYSFEMKRNFPLTVSMGDAGWTQWQSTVSTRTREDCAAAGVKYKRYRYAVHFRVTPDGTGLALGKIKLQGKFVPG